MREFWLEIVAFEIIKCNECIARLIDRTYALWLSQLSSSNTKLNCDEVIAFWKEPKTCGDLKQESH